MGMLLKLEPAMAKLAVELERLVGDGRFGYTTPMRPGADRRFGRMFGRAVETAKLASSWNGCALARRTGIWVDFAFIKSPANLTRCGG